ncbi:hypothetical protein [Chitinophaga sp.]|uniref:hypothetical protein n=1 Tax=Chitinophaga sp. TaxID=1869181 RepID=UPI0031E2300C
MGKYEQVVRQRAEELAMATFKISPYDCYGRRVPKERIEKQFKINTDKLMGAARLSIQREAEAYQAGAKKWNTDTPWIENPDAYIDAELQSLGLVAPKIS